MAAHSRICAADARRRRCADGYDTYVSPRRASSLHRASSAGAYARALVYQYRYPSCGVDTGREVALVRDWQQAMQLTSGLLLVAAVTCAAQAGSVENSSSPGYLRCAAAATCAVPPSGREPRVQGGRESVPLHARFTVALQLSVTQALTDPSSIALQVL